jgi:predicted peroxiredoxin
VAHTLLIKVTAGTDAPERSNQAFTVAAAAVAAGAQVHVWLTGEAAWFALPGRAAELVLEYATPLPDLIDLVLEAGTITLCTQCAARRSITAEQVLPGIRIAGAPSFVELALADGTQALIY